MSVAAPDPRPLALTRAPLSGRVGAASPTDSDC